jgi:hypothetical protein
MSLDASSQTKYIHNILKNGTVVIKILYLLYIHNKRNTPVLARIITISKQQKNV